VGNSGRTIVAAVALLLALALVAKVTAETRVRVIEERDATGKLWKEYAEQKKEYGIVPNGAMALGLDADLLTLHDEFGHGLLAEAHHLEEPLKHMVGMTVGRALGSEYVRSQEAYTLRKLGVEEETVQRISQDPRSAGLTDREVAALTFAQRVASSPGGIAEQDFADLQWDGLTDEEILELSMLASYFTYEARLMQVLGVEPNQYPPVE
jgi:uncharacterized peroxidase-related enzyme